MAVKIFFCYAREDEALLNKLKTHLRPLQRQGLIDVWYDRDIGAGAEWEREIDTHLNTADMILLLISSDFMYSDYCYGTEMKKALLRHERGEARVIPIILRRCHWQIAGLDKLQALPTDAIPVMSANWHIVDDAFFDITEGIRNAIEKIKKERETAPQHVIPTIPDEIDDPDKVKTQVTEKVLKRNKKASSSSQRDYQLPLDFTLPHFTLPLPEKKFNLSEVFVKSGVPLLTFVEHDEFRLLCFALAEPGQSIVLEGPSGAGKTTAMKIAINKLKKEDKIHKLVYLNADNKQDMKRIIQLRNWHTDTVIIDDFHRLYKIHQAMIADYLKELTDLESKSKRLIIVGIPQTGQALVQVAFDLATRFEVIKMKKVKKPLIHHMINRGEKALNIKFEGELDIAKVADGSLNIGQFFCFYTCSLEGISETQDKFRKIQFQIDRVLPHVMGVMSRKFGTAVKQFTTLGGPKDETYFLLLKLLANNDDGVLDLNDLKVYKPDLASAIDQFIEKELIKNFYQSNKNNRNFIFYDDFTNSLIIEDPQLIFYLKQLRHSSLMQERKMYDIVLDEDYLD